jgi:hypothetical protein
MKVIEALRSPDGKDVKVSPGRAYELANAAQTGEPGQVLRFIDTAAQMDGTTNDEVLAMMIDRLNRLEAEEHSRENVMALGHLLQARTWFELRTAARVAAMARNANTMKPEEPAQVTKQAEEPAAMEGAPPIKANLDQTKATKPPPPPSRIIKPNLGARRQAATASQE